MIYFFYGLEILVSSLLILMVITSDKEEGGLSSAIGGGAGGKGRYKPGYEEQKDKITGWLATAFVVVSLIIAAFSN
jgi:protein translocase SecG subunit